MPVTAKLSRKFYETLGDEIADELVDWFNQVDATYRTELRELNELNFARFDARIEQRAAGIEAKVEQRAAGIEAKLEQRAAGIEAKLEQRAAAIEAKLEQRAAGIETKLDQRTAELGAKLEQRIAELRAEVLTEIHAVKAELIKDLTPWPPLHNVERGNGGCASAQVAAGAEPAFQRRNTRGSW